VGLTPPHLVPKVLEKSRAVRLLNLRACVAYKKSENLPIYIYIYMCVCVCVCMVLNERNM